MLLPVNGRVTIETGAQYLERSMQSTWLVHWGSALFRTNAIVEAGGLRAEDYPLADFPLLIGGVPCKWNVACLSESLAAFRVHADVASARVGSFTGAGYDLLEKSRESG